MTPATKNEGSGAERRRATRHSVTMTAAGPEGLIGTTRDVSTTGAYIETSQRPEVDSVHVIELTWGECTATAEARVVRHDAGGIGVAFVDPGSPLQQALAQVSAEILF